MRLLDFLENLQPAAARHGQVQDDDVPMLLPYALERLLRIRRLAEGGSLESLGQDLLEALAHDGVVVCNEDSHGLPGY